MRLGYLTHVAGRRSASDAYRETIELAVAAEGMGFASFWVAQRHAFTSAGWLPSPLVLLAAVAERTSTIQLGIVTITARLESPWWLAEDAAVLDTLSEGRLQLGLGAGPDAERLASRPASSEMDPESLVDGFCAQLEGVHPAQNAVGLRRRLWWATSSAEDMEAAAARGLGVISSAPGGARSGAPRASQALMRYWSRAVDEPRVAVVRAAGEHDTTRDLVHRWSNDEALRWATDLVVQTTPAGGTESELEKMSVLANRVAPALNTAIAAGNGRLAPV